MLSETQTFAKAKNLDITPILTAIKQVKARKKEADDRIEQQRVEQQRVEQQQMRRKAEEDAKKSQDYHGTPLSKAEYDVMAALETQLGSAIPAVAKVEWNTFGWVGVLLREQ